MHPTQLSSLVLESEHDGIQHFEDNSGNRNDWWMCQPCHTRQHSSDNESWTSLGTVDDDLVVVTDSVSLE